MTITEVLDYVDREFDKLQAKYCPGLSQKKEEAKEDKKPASKTKKTK